MQASVHIDLARATHKIDKRIYSGPPCFSTPYKVFLQYAESAALSPRIH